ncbi:hypothetical protein FOA52_015279 [Chlamydomonas sp. UWO 241]|nr:hypothetical protein FOA52_015279 [Chlamydomonas sp. UWO 241]
MRFVLSTGRFASAAAQISGGGGFDDSSDAAFLDCAAAGQASALSQLPDTVVLTEGAGGGRVSVLHMHAHASASAAAWAVGPGSFALSAPGPGKRCRPSPFASLLSSSGSRPGAVPLFSLASALGRGGRPGTGSYNNAPSSSASDSDDADSDDQGRHGRHAAGPPITHLGKGGGGGGGSGEGSSGSSDSEEVQSSELGDEEIAQLASVHCSACRRPLLRPRTARRDAETLAVCDGCHRAFHRGCVQRRQLGTAGSTAAARSSSGSKEGDEEDEEQRMWFHAPGCESTHGALSAVAAAGAVALSGEPGMSLTLLRPMVAAGQETGEPGREALEHVVSLLGDAYGPLVYGVVEASDFGVLLRSEEAAASARTPLALPSAQPGDSIERRAALAVHAGDAELMAAGPIAKGSIAAATVDVYGTQMAKLDLMTTREDVRGQGHARTLVSGLEDLLSCAGVQSLLVVIDAGDKDARAMWTQHFRTYRRLNGRQTSALATEFPHFAALDRKQSVLLRRELPGAAAAAAAAAKKKKEKGGAKGGRK